MIKKIVSLFIAALLSFGLVGCGDTNDATNDGTTDGKTPTESNDNIADSIYKDGTYTASGDPWEYGSEDATIVIKDGKITSVTLRRLDKDGKEVNYDDWQGQEVDGKIYPNLKQYRVDMADMIIKNQNTNVDTISGATVSTQNWKVAVDRALEKAKA